MSVSDLLSSKCGTEHDKFLNFAGLVVARNKPVKVFTRCQTHLESERFQNRTRLTAGPKIGPYWEPINKRRISLDSFWIGSIWSQLCLNMALKGVFD